MFGEFEVETANDAGTTDDGGPAEGSVGEMVITRNWQDAVFIIKDAVEDMDYARSDAVISGTFLLDNVVGFVLDEVGNVGADVFI